MVQTLAMKKKRYTAPARSDLNEIFAHYLIRFFTYSLTFSVIRSLTCELN